MNISLNDTCTLIAAHSDSIEDWAEKANKVLAILGYSPDKALEAMEGWYDRKINEFERNIVEVKFIRDHLYIHQPDGKWICIRCCGETDGMKKYFERTAFGEENYGSNEVHHVSVDNVKFNGPATIVFFSDGSKTIVKCSGNDIYDKEKGLAMALTKRACGNKSNYNDIFHKWIDVNEKVESSDSKDISESTDTEKKVKERRANRKRSD